MKSIRDLVNPLPDTRKGLEDYVLKNYEQIRKGTERSPENRQALEKITAEEFDKYSKYLGGITDKISGAGHAVGYAADAWLLTGDIIGSLGGKFLNLLAQIPEKGYKSLLYAIHTGNYLDAFQNMFEGAISYLPGLTILDQGLSRIVQKRMIKRIVYRMEDNLGIERKSWYRRIADKIKGSYDDVKDRAGNVIGPYTEPAFAS